MRRGWNGADACAGAQRPATRRGRERRAGTRQEQGRVEAQAGELAGQAGIADEFLFSLEIFFQLDSSGLGPAKLFSYTSETRDF